MKEATAQTLTEGSISKGLFKVALPTMAGFMIQMVHDLINMAWIGRISTNAVAGMTIFATMFWLVNVLNEIIGTSSIALISQSYGKGDKDQTSLCVEQTLTFKAIVAVIACLLFSILLQPLLGFFTQDPVVQKAALDYGYIRIFFLPVMFSAYTINTAFRCVGQATKPMYLMGISAIINVILDPLFIFETVPGLGIHGLGLGVFGAALATVISVTFTFVAGVMMLMSKRSPIKVRPKMLFKLNWEIDYKLLTIGLPSGFEALLRNLVGIFTLKLVSQYGTDAVAAMGLSNRLLEFVFMPLFGLSMGGGAVIGQCLGRNLVERARKTVKMTLVYSVSIMGSVAVLAFAFPQMILGIFTEDPNLIAIGVPMMRIIIPGMLSAAVMMALGTVFSGSGYNTPFLISSITGKWLVQIPLLFIFVLFLKLPIHFVWITFVIADFTEMLVMLGFYKAGKWTRVRAI